MSDTVKNEAPATSHAGLLAEARAVRIEIMQGKGGRNAAVRLLAANQILEAKIVEQLSDEQLVAQRDRYNTEIERRNREREP